MLLTEFCKDMIEQMGDDSVIAECVEAVGNDSNSVPILISILESTSNLHASTKKLNTKVATAMTLIGYQAVIAEIAKRANTHGEM